MTVRSASSRRQTGVVNEGGSSSGGHRCVIQREVVRGEKQRERERNIETEKDSGLVRGDENN